jgi:hypothetical protein
VLLEQGVETHDGWQVLARAVPAAQPFSNAQESQVFLASNPDAAAPRWQEDSRGTGLA